MPFSDILGQERALRILYNDLARQQVAHAYLFLGPEDVGKKYTAIGFAKALNCAQAQGDFCNQCLSCQKIDKAIHPDINLIRPQGNHIRIEQMRELQNKIAFKPLEGERKVVIMDEAEKFSPEAAASLLKTLEEPPANTVIILISNNPFALPNTIISRCRVTRFNSLKPQEVSQILVEKRSFNPDQARLIASLSLGAIGKALNLDLSQILALREEVLRVFDLEGGNRIKYILNKVKDWDKDRKKAQEWLDALAIMSRDLMILASGAPSDFLINNDLEEGLKIIANKLTLEMTISILENIGKTQELLRQNVNTQLAINNMLNDIFAMMDLGRKNEN
jgi:DNA polymerase-3 subunit delta'